ncbi:MAG: HNH endonuclease [Nitrospira sp.]
MKSLEERFWEKVSKTDDCWLWTGQTMTNGYGRLRFKKDGKWCHIYAHRASMLIAGHDINDVCVLHECDNPPCVRPDHLFVGTHQNNVDDMHKKGRHNYRSHPEEKNGRAKLDRSAVKDIRRRRAAGESGPAIAKRYSVTSTLIYMIEKRQAWPKVD